MGPNSCERCNDASQKAWIQTMKKGDMKSKIMSQKEKKMRKKENKNDEAEFKTDGNWTEQSRDGNKKKKKESR